MPEVLGHDNSGFPKDQRHVRPALPFLYTPRRNMLSASIAILLEICYIPYAMSYDEDGYDGNQMFSDLCKTEGGRWDDKEVFGPEIPHYILATYDRANEVSYPKGCSHADSVNDRVATMLKTLKEIKNGHRLRSAFFWVLEASLISSGSGYVIGHKLTFADVLYFPVVFTFADTAGLFDYGYFPNIKNWYLRLGDMIEFQEGMNSLRWNLHRVDRRRGLRRRARMVQGSDE